VHTEVEVKYVIGLIQTYCNYFCVSDLLYERMTICLSFLVIIFSLADLSNQSIARERETENLIYIHFMFVNIYK